jgi:hypothetical protein
VLPQKTLIAGALLFGGIKWLEIAPERSIHLQHKFGWSGGLLQDYRVVDGHEHNGIVCTDCGELIRQKKMM